MNKKLFTLITAGAIALFSLSSCGDNVVDATDSNPVQTQATLNVVVIDQNTTKPIAATVRLLAKGTGKSAAKQAAANGAATFKNLTTGSYDVLVEAGDGYASAIVSTEIDEASGNNIYIAKDQDLTVPLFPKTAKLTGSVHYTDKNGQTKPASGAKLALQVYYSSFGGIDIAIVDNLISGEDYVVDANGKYEFTKLPAGAYYNLVLLEYTVADGTTYVSRSINDDYLYADNSVNYAGDVTLSGTNTDELFKVLGYSNPVDPTDPVVITFSSKVNVKKLAADAFGVSATAAAGADFSWNAEGTVLTITPVGSWKETFTVTGPTLTSNNNNNFIWATLTIVVNQTNLSTDAQVAGLLHIGSLTDITAKITTNWNSPSAFIQWDKLQGTASGPGNAGYDVYIKERGDIAYKLVTAIIDCPEDDVICRATVPFKNLSYDKSKEEAVADTVYVKVQGKNGQYKTNLANATVLKIWDKHRTSSDKVLSVYDYPTGPNIPVVSSTNLSLFATAQTYNQWVLTSSGVTINFPEPIDTAAAEITTPLINTNNAVPDRFIVNSVWTDRQTLKLTPYIKAGGIHDKSLNFLVKIGNLKDMAGNSIAQVYDKRINNGDSEATDYDYDYDDFHVAKKDTVDYLQYRFYYNYVAP